MGDSLTVIIDESSSFMELQSGKLVPFKGAANLGSFLSFVRQDLTTGAFEYVADELNGGESIHISGLLV